MNRYQLFRALRQHRKLSERRAMNYEQNKSAKYIVWFSMGFSLLYLMFIAIMLSLIANGSTTTTPLEFIFGLSPFIMFIDFAMRFVAQQTPAQIARPYQLLPMPRHACIDALVGSSMLTGYNCTWFAMLVPYAIMSVLFSYNLWMVLWLLLMWWLLVVANSQWYLISKTLITDSLLWWLLPVAVYAAMAAPVIMALGDDKGWGRMFDLYAGIGTMAERHPLLPLLGAVALIAVLVAINRRIQYAHVRSELVRKESTKTHKVAQMSWLDRYGEAGVYLKLELKTIMRNKNPRKSFILSIFTVSVLSIVISLTDVYDGSFNANFWCLYCYLIFGSASVAQVMSYEGNYLDGLMTHKENLLRILTTKYYLYSTILLWPVLLMLPTVVAGKWSLLMLIAYAVFTAGFQYFMLFQMAVYNKQTMPLNTKFVSKGGLQTNYVQLAVSLGAYIVPAILVTTMQVLFNDTVAYATMLGIGLVFMGTHKIWLRNIYNRWMRRRYVNMEAMRASR